MTELSYKSFLSFELSLSNCKVGKEGIDQEFLALFNNHKEISFLYNRLERNDEINDDLVKEYYGEPFANLSFINRLVISDCTIAYSYEERTNQLVILPNIFSYVYVLLAALKVSEKVAGNMGKHPIKCSVKIDNNTDCFFYEKYSPLLVDYSRMLKYGMNREAAYEIEIEDFEDIFDLINRFYHQFGTSHSVAKPYVTVDRDFFVQVYERL